VDQPNLEHWEQLAALHGTGPDRYYDLEALVGGATLMGEEEAAALARAAGPAGLAGTEVMHLQCHIGCDAITMARQGAKVTGVDFSSTALARLRELAVRCDVAVSTVEADSRDLPRDLDHRFDIVYATIGVLCWIDDIDAWMRCVARVLRPGGTLVLVELHPLLTMIDQVDPLVLDFPYLFDGAHSFSGTGSYANRDADVAWTTVQYAHGLAEVLMAARGAGLATTYVEEHTSMSFDPRGMPGDGLDADGRYRLRIGLGARRGYSRAPGAELPVLYTLLATSTPLGAQALGS
jgi:SAM-dependent methyltransferase